jgi:Protein of unknown function (DUF3769)
VGKKSYQYVGQRVWKVARYLLLCTCYSIGISLRPTLAAPIPASLPAAPALAQTSIRSLPLAYAIVQAGAQEKPNINLFTTSGTVELNSEQQEFDNNTQIITATGKVVLRFNQALLYADRLRVDLNTKIATADGNVSLIRGRQILYGDRFEYNFEDDKGTVSVARGDIYQPTLASDLNVIPRAGTSLPAGEKPFPEPLLSESLRNNQPVTNITSTSSTGVTIGNERDIDYQPTLKPKGTINRLRFQADKIEFVADRVTAEKVRITNDPFSPPELQVKADRAQFKTINSEEDEVTARNARITVENSFDIPLIRDRLVLNKIGKEPNPFGFGFDADERGGFFLENTFYPIFDRQLRLTVTPQYFVQRAVTGFKFFDPSVLGVKVNLEANTGPNTTLQASASLAGVTPDNLSNTFRGKAALKQNLDLFSYPHLFTGEAVYRDRIFNGSLGFQDVQSSIGGVLTSSIIPIGTTGVNLDYLLGAQVISANTDRPNLLAANRSSDLVVLNRYQTAANLTKSFRLWEGKGLPANQKETYNYSPVPVVPFLQLNTGLQGAYNSYSNGDSQSSLGYSVGIQGQIGNFSRSSFDYTGFNLNYFQRFLNSSSPFLFDRFVNNRTLSAGISQQISGPVRAGIQTSIDLDKGQQISTDYYLEYSRRTYNFIIRYNPTLGLGTIGFRLNDFNWDGVTPNF